MSDITKKCPPLADDGMLTRQEVAARLRVTPKTVDRMTLRGELRVHRVGRFPRYLWREVLEDTAEPTVEERVRRAVVGLG